ncbi:MAG: type II secretion system protein [Abitibacteriaceae bacterium]|nr:type II secretion system protein [Abditibacteriaceae bacterium]MBV9865707.1 type II secretion system protein [Abditibacteriaceae bacterium]
MSLPPCPRGLRHKAQATPYALAKSGFTLIELLVVIAILSILAALLFPVFATAREKSRQAVCQSNLKQVMGAVLMYASDNDEKMPLAISGDAQVGPATARAAGIAEFGIHTEVMPYLKSSQVLRCPDDNGFVPGGSPTCGGQPCAGDNLADAYGMSYEVIKENFSQLPSTSPAPSNPRQYTVVKNPNGLLGQPGGPFTHNPPFPLPMAFFQRPADTCVMHCYVGPWETPFAPGTANLLHPAGVTGAFLDGHVKWIKNQTEYDSYCEGPTYSPVRNADQPHYNPDGDGSCGAERNSRE